MIECEWIQTAEEKKQISREILEQLPEWFGMPESTACYVRECRELPFWAYKENGAAKGFIALKETSPFTAEIYVMGVLKEKHHCGVGSALMETFMEYAGQKGYEYVQVKTVQKGHYKEYDITNAFYEHMGFRELECLPSLWDEWNPCQIYIKAVRRTGMS